MAVSSVSKAFVTLFDTEVKHAYQAQRALAGTVREKSAQGAKTVKFPTLGEGVASRRSPMVDVMPMHVDHAQVTATLDDWIAAEFSDIFNQSHINWDERNELVTVVAGAIGRRMDQVIIDALTSANTATLTAQTIDLGEFIKAKTALDKKNVPHEDRTCLIHAEHLAKLLELATVTSSDYHTVKALVSGELNTYLGMKIVCIGDRSEGGLPRHDADPSTWVDMYAWHKNAIGLGTAMDMTTKIDYVPEKTSYLVASMFSAGAVGIDPDGIYAARWTVT